MDTHQYHINYDRLNDCISEKLTTYYKYQFLERQFIYIEFLGNCLLQKSQEIQLPYAAGTQG